MDAPPVIDEYADANTDLPLTVIPGPRPPRPVDCTRGCGAPLDSEGACEVCGLVAQ